MVTILRKIKIRFNGNFEIKDIDKKKYHLVVAIKEVETSREIKGWCFGKCQIVFFGVIDSSGFLSFIDSKYCMIRLG